MLCRCRLVGTLKSTEFRISSQNLRALHFRTQNSDCSPHGLLCDLITSDILFAHFITLIICPQASRLYIIGAGEWLHGVSWHPALTVYLHNEVVSLSQIRCITWIIHNADHGTYTVRIFEAEWKQTVKRQLLRGNNQSYWCSVSSLDGTRTNNVLGWVKTKDSEVISDAK